MGIRMIQVKTLQKHVWIFIRMLIFCTLVSNNAMYISGSRRSVHLNVNPMYSYTNIVINIHMCT